MWSGCSPSQDGSYPADQHYNDFGALLSAGHFNTVSLPVAHTELRPQIIMVAHHEPDELRTQHPKPAHRVCTPYTYSSLNVTPGGSNTGQHTGQGSRNGASHQKPQSSGLPSFSSSSVALKDYSGGVTAQTFPLNNQYSSNSGKENTSCSQIRNRLPEVENPDNNTMSGSTKNKKVSGKFSSNPLLHSLLTTSTLSDDSTEPSISKDFLYKEVQKVNCSLVASSCEQNTARSQDACHPRDHRDKALSNSATHQRRPQTNEQIHPRDRHDRVLSDSAVHQGQPQTDEQIHPRDHHDRVLSDSAVQQGRPRTDEEIHPRDLQDKILFDSAIHQGRRRTDEEIHTSDHQAKVLFGSKIQRRPRTDEEIQNLITGVLENYKRGVTLAKSDVHLAKPIASSNEIVKSRDRLVCSVGQPTPARGSYHTVQSSMNMGANAELSWVCGSTGCPESRREVMRTSGRNADRLTEKDAGHKSYKERVNKTIDGTSDAPKHVMRNESLITDNSNTVSAVDHIQIVSVTSMSGDQAQCLWNEPSNEHSMDMCIEDPPPPQNDHEQEHVANTLPGYEDITDDESVPGLEASSSLACFEKPVYEDISDEENPKIQSLLEREGQSRVIMGNISDDKAQLRSCPGLIETRGPDNLQLSEPDESDDDYLVMCLSMSDLKFESDSDLHDVPVHNVPESRVTSPIHSETKCPPPTLASSSMSWQIEIFDTVQSFFQAKVPIVPANEVDSTEGGPSSPQQGREPHNPEQPEESNDTDDSCDYSSSPSDHNHLTVSRHFLKTPQKCYSGSEKENESNKTTNEQKSQRKGLDKSRCIQKLKELVKGLKRSKTCRQRVSRKGNTDDVYSDSEAESNKNYKMAGKQKRSRKKCHSEVGPQLNNTVFKKEDEHRVEESNVSKEEIIMISSDTMDSMDESEQILEEESQMVLVSSKLMDHDSSTDMQSKKHSNATMKSDHRLPSEKLDQMKTLVNGSVPQQQSNFPDTPVKEEARGVSSDMSLDRERSRQLSESERGTPHKQNKTNKQKESISFPDPTNIPKKDCLIHQNKATTDAVVKSVSKDSSHALQSSEFQHSTHDRCSAESGRGLSGSSCDTPQKPSEKSGERQFHSGDRRCVIPQLFVNNPSSPSGWLKPLKVSTDRRLLPSKPPTATSKKTHSTKKNSECRDANDMQTSIRKHKPDSMQPSLPNLESPSNSSMASTQCLPHSDKATLPSHLPKPAHVSSSKRRHTHPATSDRPYSKTRDKTMNASRRPSAHERLKMDWNKSYFPTRRDRKTSTTTEEPSKTSTTVSNRETNQGRHSDRIRHHSGAATSTHDRAHRHDRAPISDHSGPRKQRRNSRESETILMKRAKMEAKAWTKATHHNSTRKKSNHVGEGYKWREAKSDKFDIRMEYGSPSR